MLRANVDMLGITNISGEELMLTAISNFKLSTLKTTLSQNLKSQCKQLRWRANAKTCNNGENKQLK